MKYALALAGGGTRGAFECGVWRALKELGIEISAIVGTSIGAVNGAMFTAGNDTFSLWKSISADDVLKLPRENDNKTSMLISLVRSISQGGIDTSPFREFLNKHLSETDVRKSPVEYGLCTYSVDEKRELYLFKEDIPDGKLIDYVMASACFPLFKPSVIDDKVYSDGAVRNNLPINMLIGKGYDTIISVSVKGIGIVSDTDVCGTNMIEVNCPVAEVGILDFDKNSIMKSIDSGYCECMKVFGRYKGTYFYFYSDSYEDAVSRFGAEIIKGIESAAKMLKIYPYKAYSIEQLIRLVLSKYESNKALSRLVSFMQKEDHSIIHEKLDLLGKYFDAANAVVYFSKYYA